MNRYLISAVTFMVSAFAAVHAAEIDFTYNFNGLAASEYGTRKAETYDVAVRISGSSFGGKRIKSLKVEIPGAPDGFEASGWLSSKLQLRTQNGVKVNRPDLASVEATVDSGILTVDFPNEITVPAGGLYVGYTFAVTDALLPKMETPVVTVPSDIPDALWIHSSETHPRWTDWGKLERLASPMVVVMEGDFSAVSASAALKNIYYFAKDEANSLSFSITNQSTTPIADIAYTLSVMGSETTGSIHFDEPVAGVPGTVVPVGIELKDFEEIGLGEIILDIDKINGEINTNPGARTEAPCEVLLFRPVTRPLVEEYTGLNCGWCPRGYVMLEEMKHLHPDRFIALSYHSQAEERGAMEIMSTGDFPVHIGSYPSATVDRGVPVDPAGIPEKWNSECNRFSPAEISVSLRYSDDAHTRLEAMASVRFAKDIADSQYRLSMALVADGLSNPDWRQHNSYSAVEPSEEYDGPYWALFVGRDEWITGLEYNDVVVWYPDVKGIEDSLPESIVAGAEYTFSTSVNVEDIVNLRGGHFVNNYDLTRMIGIIVDTTTGKAVNCADSGYPSNGSGITGAECDSEIERTEYFSLQGMRVAPDSEGLKLRVDYLMDGSQQVRKVF